MTVKFANSPSRKLVEMALERFVVEADRSRREKVEKDDLEPAEKEKSPQNRI